MTPLDSLIEALARAGDYNPAAEAAPEAVVWCDEKGEFAPLLPALRARLPHLLTYGTYSEEARTGPAIWVRAAVARALGEESWPDGVVVPIVYIPGVGREKLRAAEECPELLKALVWFTVAGSFFGHVNGKDWTLRGFLAAERGPLKLDLPDDPATRAALAHAAPRLFTTPVEQLRGRRLDADALHGLIAPDLDADVLDWLEGAFSRDSGAGRFAAFATKAKKELKLDPSKASRHDGAVLLVVGEGRWSKVWTRFAATGGNPYPGIIKLLDLLQPARLDADPSRYPRLNREGEDRLRKALLQLVDLSQPKAEECILALEEEHGLRRGWLWAKRGEAPLASALGHLVTLVENTALAPHDPEALAVSHFQTGWRADFATLGALAAAPRVADRDAVIAALRAIYLPWLDEGAQALQALAKAGKVPFATPAKPPKANTLVFVDGLRMDLAQRLAELLQGEGALVNLSWRWSGFPTVTATCKPLVSPVAAAFKGSSSAGELYPSTADGKSVAKPVLDKVLNQEGWATANALLPEGKLWCEAGSFDAQGHALGAGLAGQVEQGLRDVADRVLALTGSGRKVRVVTDHGWLLMPGGLPTVALDAGLLEPKGKRSRCALVKTSAETSYLQLAWTWNPDVRIATATGAAAFLAGQEYAHGGVSPQECILPVIDISAMGPKRHAAITSVVWEGLRLRVSVEGAGDVLIDLLEGHGTLGLPIAVRRVVPDNGKVNFLVKDEHEDKEACIVVRDHDETVLATRMLKVGEA